ncbi:TPA: transporter [Clostridioides difficile]|uniref:Transporter n=4 Tax=Clostridioides difficile TaxID=1496 RepID=Q183F5_CLOD6|nr:transporter [Clostridioides difficile]EQE15478.1 putative membrane protein [Clostridioides difficile CD17]EQE57301.1 putative membrane protein [Clostridioides difficile CD44]EQF61664.1 putative membrane protein [Clostridioides difficile CD196]EQF76176.1 putative membrane protein [Clostridioides difficile CD211]EQG44398.1 putative membrane protein [Clostridioides difficile DA00134]EQG56321.1 putative membrane protein [Clostridioides difficile DA00142]EQG74440.1 putative membrane protein [C
MVLTGAHYIYILFMVIILITMIMKKDTIVPCILGVFFMGLFFEKNIFGAITAVFNSFIISLNELGPIILIIAIMVALSKALEANNAIQYMVRPFSRVIKNSNTAFFVTGFVMLVLSWFFWPTPAVALVGAVFLPVAMRAGLPAIGVAVALNLFGHGLALSTDFVIQGAPSITAGAAGVAVSYVINDGMILFWVMGIVTISMAFYTLKRDINKGMFREELKGFESEEVEEFNGKSKIATILVALGFLADIIAMYVFDLKGGDASALLGGTAVFLIIIINVINFGKDSLENVCENIIDGFVFGIKIFGAIIPIAAFFYMGEVAPLTGVFGKVLAPGSQGLLSDIGIALSQTIPLNKFAVSGIETVVGAITGLDGSGFSGISLVGSLASVFGTAINASVGALAALGQISGIWVGGGCLVPWGLISAAAICGVSPIELAKRNFVPVITGLVVTTIVAMFII